MGREITVFLLACLVELAYSDLGVCQLSETGSVRITGLNSSYVGYVEICRDGLWIPVSYEEDDEWTKKNSIVVCRELGFLGAIQIMNNEGPAPPQVSTTGDVSVGWQYYSVECNGLETHLADCSWTIKNVKERKKDVIVLCTNELENGELAVVGGSGLDGEGVVLVYSSVKNYGWSPVCVNEWDDEDARVACRQLGYVGGYSSAYSPEDVTSPNQLSRKRYSHFGCSGDESKLTDCSFVGPYPYKCQSTDYAGVYCTRPGDGNTILKLNVSLLVLMIIISLLLIIILILLLRCTIIKFGKKSSPTRRQRRHLYDRDAINASSRIVHTELDLEAPYASRITIAPPTYAETLLADQITQSTQSLDVEGSAVDCRYDQRCEMEERSRSTSPLVDTIGNGNTERSTTFRQISTSCNVVRETSSPAPSEAVGSSSEHLIPATDTTL